MDIRSLLQKLFHGTTIRPASEIADGDTDGNTDFTGGICMSEDKTVRLDFGNKECRIVPYKSPIAPGFAQYYKKLELSPAEQMRMSEFFKKISAQMGTENSNRDYYVAEWPDGFPDVLPPLTSGGDAIGALVNAGGGATPTALAYSLVQVAFSLLSLIARVFLWEIVEQLAVINRKLDEILGFLYGDKNAELQAAINFTRYAYENFSSIMEHEGQRNATIASLQSARMTAMQDMEFYLSQLNSVVSVDTSKKFHRKEEEIRESVDKAIKISECLELSIQLCISANLMEIYYSQNYDPKHLRYMETEVENYISRYEKQTIADFSSLKNSLSGLRARKKDQEAVGALIQRVERQLDELMNGKADQLKAELNKALRSLQKKTECCIGADGTTYLKTED